MRPVPADALLPELDYLPPVKRDAVDAYFQFPPGMSEKTTAEEEEYIKVLDQRMAPLMSGEREPALKNYYILTWPGGGGMGAGLWTSRPGQGTGKDHQRTRSSPTCPTCAPSPPRATCSAALAEIDGMELHLQSRDREATGHGRAALGEKLLREALPEANVRVNPGLEMAEPELRCTPMIARISRLGWSAREVGVLVRAMGDGLYVGEHFDGEKRMNVILRAEALGLARAAGVDPHGHPSGAMVPLVELVDVRAHGGAEPAAAASTAGAPSLSTSARRRTCRWSMHGRHQTRQVEPQLKRPCPADGSILYGGSANA